MHNITSTYCQQNQHRHCYGWAPYFTVIIPYTEIGMTEWHPNTPEGPFSTLSRGAFLTEAEAITWATDRLNGQPYSIRFVDGPEAAPCWCDCHEKRREEHP